MCPQRLLSAEWPRRIWSAALFAALALLIGSSATAAPFDPDDDEPTTWFRIEYVNFWTSHASLAAPLVTTGDAAGLGRLGAAQTQSLLGPGSLPAPVFPGAKVTLGGWLYDDFLGGELNVFGTALRASGFSASSGTAGPLLAVPFADVTSGTPKESSLVVAQPGVSSGRVWADDAMEFSGLDAAALVSLDEHIMNPNVSLTLLGGIKALSFRERFKFSSGTDFLSGASLRHNDMFLANDSFAGVDFGVRGGFRLRRWTIEATGRTAIGASLSTMYIGAQDGMSLAYTRIQTVPGEGWFAQPTNIGRWYRQAFSVVPSAQLRVGYDLTSRLRLTVGYEAFFWMHMLRAPNQIDRNINLNRAIGLAAGPALPSPSPNYTNFWAQGFTAGLQFNY
ncbi:MAG TPA: BBP7 family outer membrane beta-barrel protein [Pirellulales bacterium]|nr:BBP7 family outer membrane beta-barrel protein [Pirellulales bacterium]